MPLPPKHLRPVIRRGPACPVSTVGREVVQQIQQLLNRRDPHTTIRARGHHAGCGCSVSDHGSRERACLIPGVELRDPLTLGFHAIDLPAAYNLIDLFAILAASA